jgi:hypothetical protein
MKANPIRKPKPTNTKRPGAKGWTDGAVSWTIPAMLRTNIRNPTPMNQSALINRRFERESSVKNFIDL